MTMITKKLYFSLLEVLLVVAIVSIIAAAIAISAGRAIQEQRFRTEVAVVVNTLRLAQQLMLILNTDVLVKFTARPDQQGIDYTLEFDDPLTERWQKEIKRPRASLTEIHFMSFNNAVGSFNLRFFSGGTVMSQGILRIASHADPNNPAALNSYICLMGFPHFIQNCPDHEEAAREFDAEKTYAAQLTQVTTAEIREKIRLYSDENK